MKPLSLVFVVAAIFGGAVTANAEDVTLTTYYPSPRGVYQEVRATNKVDVITRSSPGPFGVGGALDNPIGGVCPTGSTPEDVNNDGIVPQNGECRYWLLSVQADGSLLSSAPSFPTPGAHRFMWLPGKAAVRAGNTFNTEWDPANIGDWSVAFGDRSNASGNGSFATGIGSVASGIGAVAMGAGNDTASGDYGLAMGLQATASGNTSIAIGSNVSSTRDTSVAIGQWADATANHAMVLGHGHFAGPADKLINNIADSLMIGFNSNIPTLFVGPSSGNGTFGKVGIGTSTPAGVLDVRGQDDQQSVVTFMPGLDDIATPPPALMMVGIGTTNPTAYLHVVENPPGLATGLFRVDEESSTPTTPALAVVPNGNVGIGTEPANARLTIKGWTDGEKLLSVSQTGNLGETLSITNNVITTKGFLVSNGKLQVNGVLYVNQQSNALPAFRVDDEPSDTTPFVISQTGDVSVGALSTANVNILGTVVPAKLRVSGPLLIDGALGQAWMFADSMALNGGVDSVAYIENNGAGADPQIAITFGGDQVLNVGHNPKRVDITGTLNVSGSKNFMIDHPLDPAHKLLVHSTIEGPEAAVLYRGEAHLTAGEASVALPDYFEALTRKEGRTVLLTLKNGWSPLYVNGTVENGRFMVKTTKDGNPSQEFFWEVKAVRGDIPPLQVEKAK